MNPNLSDALRIWRAGTDAVHGQRAVEDHIHFDGRWLAIEDEAWDLRGIERVVVVGAGKATAAMADGLLHVFQKSGSSKPSVMGWVNVPEGSFEAKSHHPIHYHPARPMGSNEPTLSAMQGARRILDLASTTRPTDLFVCLLSGGGSALLPLPIEGVSLEDKLAVTRMLSSRGASIVELNTVRRALSRIKAGGLGRATQAGVRLCLVLSDVLGDPIDMIASGPCWLKSAPDPKHAMEVLSQFDPRLDATPPSVIQALTQASVRLSKRISDPRLNDEDFPHFVIGNNATAVDAAGTEAVALGYEYWMQSATQSEGDVASVASSLIKHLDLIWERGAPNCIILGGEPTVTLPEGRCGKGGRNQQLALELLLHLIQPQRSSMANSMAFLSGGTDGEDGPTDAAGAWVDPEVLRRMRALNIDPTIYRDRCDAYPFFEAVNGLLKTGPTQTNVCDLRVAIIRRPNNRLDGAS